MGNKPPRTDWKTEARIIAVMTALCILTIVGVYLLTEWFR